VSDAVRALLCVDGIAADALLEAAGPLLGETVVWVPVHIVDPRPWRGLGLPRGGITGRGPLSRSQLQASDTATAEHTRASMDAADASLGRLGLAREPPQIRVGEPGPEICGVARDVAANVIVLFASRRARAGASHGGLGRTARFVVEHAPCAVLLVR
jgi:nucleotide-binding universal stress UspA family protein